jgi:plasmid replication initiation protein
MNSAAIADATNTLKQYEADLKEVEDRNGLSRREYQKVSGLEERSKELREEWAKLSQGLDTDSDFSNSIDIHRDHLNRVETGYDRFSKIDTSGFNRKERRLVPGLRLIWYRWRKNRTFTALI